MLCAVVIAGEFMAYGPNVHNYSADAERNGSTVDISVSTSGSDTYSAIVMDNGTHPAMTQLYIYSDIRYDEFFDDASDFIKMKKLNFNYTVDQIIRTLSVRGFDKISVLYDKELLEAMESDITGPVSKGLLLLSYGLPESIYSGSPDDVLFKWIEQGGFVYSMSSPLGMFYHSDDGLVTVDDFQDLFFGKECMNPVVESVMSTTDIAHGVIDGNGLTKALALKWNRIQYALDVSSISGAFAMGFSEGNYSTVSMVPFGSGMICVLGGIYDRQQCDDFSQIIASGVSCYTQVIEIHQGSFTRESVNLHSDIPAGMTNVSVFVSIGGYYVTYGRMIQC